MTNFEELTNKILDEMSEFEQESKKHIWKGNQSAGKRARLISCSLEKNMREWRGLSTGRTKVEE